MFFSAFGILVLGAGSVLGAPFQNTTTGMNCGSQPSAAWITAAEADFSARQVALGPDVGTSAAGISVFWHVIFSDKEGNIPDSLITNTIPVLNKYFSPADLSFQLVGINKVQNSDWFYNAIPGSQQESNMKQSLRQGGSNVLNVYSLNMDNSGYLGYAAFPQDYRSKPVMDGVLIDWTTLPGGPQMGLNTGKILVHEVGHWVGLYHTFQGGCSYPGDYVEDTPAEASSASGCPTGRDSCSGVGIDPIHNHMDYTVDACRDQFTSGQITRLRMQIAVYRGITN